jgi:hypothetical protein
MKETPRLHLNSLAVRNYNIAGNRVKDKILKVRNATMNQVPTSIVAEILAENTCLVEPRAYLKERHFIVHTDNTVKFNFKLSIQCKFRGRFLTAQSKHVWRRELSTGIRLGTCKQFTVRKQPTSLHYTLQNNRISGTANGTM